MGKIYYFHPKEKSPSMAFRRRFNFRLILSYFREETSKMALGRWLSLICMLVIMLSVLEANIDLNDMNEADAYYNGEEAPNDNTAVGLRMQAKKRQQEKGRWKTTCTFWRYSKCKRMGNLSVSRIISILTSAPPLCYHHSIIAPPLISPLLI